MTGTGALLAATLATEVPDQYEVTPGLPGFLATFAVLVVFLLLIRSFNKNMRRVNANERHRQTEAAAAAQAEAEETTAREAVTEPTDAEAAQVIEVPEGRADETRPVDGDAPAPEAGPRG